MIDITIPLFILVFIAGVITGASIQRREYKKFNHKDNESKESE